MRRPTARRSTLAAVALTAVLTTAVSTSTIPGHALADPPSTAGQAAAGRGGDLRVMDWNIHFGVAAGTEEPDLGRVAAVIRAEEPDVVVLNEVHLDDDLPGGHGDQPAQLAALLAGDGYRYRHYDAAETIVIDDSGDEVSLGCGTHPPAGGTGSSTGRYTCGQLVLSRHPIYSDPDDPRGPEHVLLPTGNVEPGGRARRGLLAVTVRVPGAGDVRVLATHLSTPSSTAHVEDQKAQVRTALDHLGDVGQPLVLAGDLNMRPSDTVTPPTANSLMRSWIADAGLVDTWTQVADSHDGVTVPGSYGRPDGQHPDRRIDYVYASPAFEVRGAHVSLVDPEAADHLPVITDLRARGPRPPAHASVSAGEGGAPGWAHVVVDRGRTSLTACKNAGTVTDDGTVVRAGLHKRPGARPVRIVADGGTSRDRCTVHTWKGRVPARTVLRACAVRGDEVLGCREETVG